MNTTKIFRAKEGRRGPGDDQDVDLVRPHAAAQRLAVGAQAGGGGWGRAKEGGRGGGRDRCAAMGGNGRGNRIGRDNGWVRGQPEDGNTIAQHPAVKPFPGGRPAVL